jgi:hypothetical protein
MHLRNEQFLTNKVQAFLCLGRVNLWRETENKEKKRILNMFLVAIPSPPKSLSSPPPPQPCPVHSLLL